MMPPLHWTVTLRGALTNVYRQKAKVLLNTYAGGLIEKMGGKIRG